LVSLGQLRQKGLKKRSKTGKSKETENVLRKDEFA
jgi:hypothetical protein